MAAAKKLQPDYFALLAADAPAVFQSDEERERERREQELHRRQERLSRSRPALPTEDIQALVDGRPGESAALDWVRRWHAYQRAHKQPPRTFLALLGLTGRGKTYAGGWLLAEEGGYYVTADELRRKVTSPSYKDRDWLDLIVQGRCVVVDDVGTEFDAAGANAALFELVNRRLSMARGFTLLTGNLTETEFRERYDERTVRRIEHQGALVTVEGTDLRRGA